MGLSTPVIVAAASAFGVLGLGGALTSIGPWYNGLRKPSWQPPGWLFAPAWSVIAIFAVWSGVLAWGSARSDGQRLQTVLLFALNGVLNILWSALFFKLQRPDWALVEVAALWLSIAALMIDFAGRAPGAAWLIAPYLLWVSFAAWLNLTIVRLNAPFPHAVTRG